MWWAGRGVYLTFQKIPIKCAKIRRLSISDAISCLQVWRPWMHSAIEPSGAPDLGCLWPQRRDHTFCPGAPEYELYELHRVTAHFGFAWHSDIPNIPKLDLRSLTLLYSWPPATWQIPPARPAQAVSSAMQGGRMEEIHLLFSILQPGYLV